MRLGTADGLVVSVTRASQARLPNAQVRRTLGTARLVPVGVCRARLTTRTANAGEIVSALTFALARAAMRPNLLRRKPRVAVGVIKARPPVTVNTLRPLASRLRTKATAV